MRFDLLLAAVYCVPVIAAAAIVVAAEVKRRAHRAADRCVCAARMSACACRDDAGARNPRGAGRGRMVRR